jgi:hypothetical protein
VKISDYIFTPKDVFRLLRSFRVRDYVGFVLAVSWYFGLSKVAPGLSVGLVTTSSAAILLVVSRLTSVVSFALAGLMFASLFLANIIITKPTDGNKQLLNWLAESALLFLVIGLLKVLLTHVLTLKRPNKKPPKKQEEISVAGPLPSSTPESPVVAESLPEQASSSVAGQVKKPQQPKFMDMVKKI